MPRNTRSYIRLVHLICVVILSSSFLFLFSCVHSHGKEQGKVEVIVGKGFKNLKSRTKNIYVSVQGNPAAEDVKRETEVGLRRLGFTIKDNPSAAERILQIAIVYAGEAGIADLERAVASGYDTKVPVIGSDVSGLVVDALLVARAVPDGKNRTQRNLKNISQRQVQGSDTTRFAIYGRGILNIHPLPQAFVEVLAHEICGKVSMSGSRNGESEEKSVREEKKEEKRKVVREKKKKEKKEKRKNKIKRKRRD